MAGALIIALALRILWLSFVDPTPSSDGRAYYEIGYTLSQGFGYREDGNPNAPFSACWPIGYPFFLSLIFRIFGDSIQIAKVVNLVLDMCNLLLVYWIAKEEFNSRIAGRLSILPLIAFPGQIAFLTLLYNEVFFTFLILLGVALWILAKKNKLNFFIFMSALVFAAAVYTKPQAILIPAFLALVDYFCLSIHSEKRSFLVKKIIFMYIVIISALTPWTVRNYKLFSQFIFICTDGGPTLLIGNNPVSNGTFISPYKLPSLGYDVRQEKMFRDAKKQRPISKTHTQQISGKIAINFIKNNPLLTIKRIPKKIYYLFIGDSHVFNINTRSTSRNVSKFIYKNLKFFEIYYATFLWTAVGCILLLVIIKLFISKIYFSLYGLAIIACSAFVCSVFFGCGRYHGPLIPWFSMYIGSFFSILLSGYNHSPEQRFGSTNSNSRFTLLPKQ